MKVNLSATFPNQQISCNPKPKFVTNVTQNVSNVIRIPCISFGNARANAVPFIYGAECNAGAKSGGVSAVVTDLAQYGYEFTPYYGGSVSETINTKSTLLNQPVTLESGEQYHPLQFEFQKTEVLRKVDPFGVERPVFIHPDKLYECGGDISKVNPRDVQWLEEVCSKKIETSSGKETAAIYKVITLSKRGKAEDLPHKRFYVFTQGTGAMKKAYEGGSVAYSTGASVLGGADPYAINSKAFIEMLPDLAEKGYHAKALLLNDPQTAYACEFLAKKILENDPFYSKMVTGYICHNPGAGYQAKSSLKAMFLNFANQSEIDMVEKNLVYQKIKSNKFLEEQFFATFMPDLVDAKGGTSGLMLALRYRENGLLNYLGTVSPGAAKSYCLGGGEADAVKFLMKDLFEKGMFQGILNGLNNDGIDPRKPMGLPYYKADKLAEMEQAAIKAHAEGKGELLNIPDAIKKEFETFDPDIHETGQKLIELKDAEAKLDTAKEGLPEDILKAHEKLDNANTVLENAKKEKKTKEIIKQAKTDVETAEKELADLTIEKVKKAEADFQTAKTALEGNPDDTALKTTFEQAQTNLDNIKKAQTANETYLEAKKQYNNALSEFNQTQSAVEKLKSEIKAAEDNLTELKKELAKAPDFDKTKATLDSAQTKLNNAKQEYLADKGSADKKLAFEKAESEFNAAKAEFERASKARMAVSEAQKVVDEYSYFPKMAEEQTKLEEAFKEFDKAKTALKNAPEDVNAKTAFTNALENLNKAKANMSAQFDLSDIVAKKQRNAANLFTRINLAQQTNHPEYVLGKVIPGARIWGEIDPKYIERITSPNLAERQMVDLFVCWGRADEQKGLDIAIESFRRFVEESTEAYKSGKTSKNLAENAVLVMGGPIGDSYLRDSIRGKVAEALSKDYMKGRFVFLDGFAPNAVLASACTFDITPSRWAPCELVDHEARKYLGLPIVTGIEGLDDKNFDVRFDTDPKPTGYKTIHNNLTSINEISEELNYQKSMQTYESAQKCTESALSRLNEEKTALEKQIAQCTVDNKESEKLALQKKLTNCESEISKQKQIKTILEQRKDISSQLDVKKKEFSAIERQFEAATKKQQEVIQRFLDITTGAEVPADRVKALAEIETTLKQTEQTIANARRIQQEGSALEIQLSNLKNNLQKTSGHIVIISDRTKELLDAYYAELAEFKAKVIKNLKQKRVFADKDGKLFTVISDEIINKEVEAAITENLEIKSGEKAILAPKRQAVIDSMTNDNLVEIYRDTTRLTQDERHSLMRNNHKMKIRWENNSELQRIWEPGHYEGSVWKEGHFVRTNLSGKELYETLCFNGAEVNPKSTFVNFSYSKLLEAQEKIIKLLESVGEKTDGILPKQNGDTFVSGVTSKFKAEKGLTFAEKYLTKQTALIAGGTVAVAALAYYLFAPKKEDTEKKPEMKKHLSTFTA